MRDKKRYVLYVLLMIILASCKQNRIEPETKVSEYIENSGKGSFDELEKENDDIWLYNPYEYKLELFHMKENKLEDINESDDALEYCFDLTADYPYVSIGNADEMTFCVYDISKNKMNKMISLDGGYIVPFATNGSNFLYLMSKMNGEDYEKSIVKIEESKIVEVLKLGDLAVESGTLIDETLYYSVYLQDSDLYDIYEYNLKTKEKPVLRKSAVVKGDLYQLDNQLLYSNDDKIYNESIEIPYKGVCVKIIDEANLLVQWDTNDEAGMVLRFNDVYTGIELESVAGGINYRVSGNTIYVYTFHGLISFEV